MFRSLLALSLFTTAVFAQGVDIGLPISDQKVKSGGSFVVQVQLPDSSTGSIQVAVVIGLQSCPYGPCDLPSDNMGFILYNGPFHPQRHEEQLPPYQNFTFKVPSAAAKGDASIGVAHVLLLGAGLYPVLETVNQTIHIV